MRYARPVGLRLALALSALVALAGCRESEAGPPGPTAIDSAKATPAAPPPITDLASPDEMADLSSDERVARVVAAADASLQTTVHGLEQLVIIVRRRGDCAARAGQATAHIRETMERSVAVARRLRRLEATLDEAETERAAREVEARQQAVEARFGESDFSVLLAFRDQCPAEAQRVMESIQELMRSLEALAGP